MGRTTVGLTAYLGSARLKLGDLRAVQPGDIVQLDKRVQQDLLLRIKGHTKFAGKLGNFRGHKALHITREAEPDEIL